MDNSFKAFIMAASVILFIIAVSVGVLSYSRVLDATDSILTSSEKFTMTAESFEEREIDTTREIPGSEVVFSILNMRDSMDYTFTRIYVDGVLFTAEDLDEGDLKNYIGGRTYQIESQDYNTRTIWYVSV